MVLTLLHWLDADAGRFLAAGWGSLALCLALALAPAWRKRWWSSAPVFAFALFLGLFAFRWHPVLDNIPYGNPDESQIVSDALTYARDPVPYRLVDGNTSGPFNGLSLMVFTRLLGRDFDATTARLYGLLCLWLAALATWRIFARVGGETRGRLLTLPLLAALAVSMQMDLIQFNNEYPPVALLALAMWAAAPLLDRASPPGAGRLALAGWLLGIVPLAKPQGAPIALWLGLAAVVLVWRAGAAGRGRSLATLIGAAALPGVTFLAVCVAAGTWHDMTASFLANNVQYAGNRMHPWSESFGKIWEVAVSHDAPHVFLALCGAAALPVAAFGPSFAAPARRFGWLALGGAAAAVVAFNAPGRNFGHYLLLLYVPAVWLLGAAVLGLVLPRPAAVTADDGGAPAVPRWRTVTVWTLWAVVAASVGARGFGWTPPLFRNFGRPDPGAREVAAVVAAYARPGEGIAIWGWLPRVYLWTQQWHVTREGVAERQIAGVGDRDYYRERFLADLKRTRPPVFLDTTGPADFAYHERDIYRHERWLPLANWVVLNYALVGEPAGVRVYARLDRTPRPDLPAAKWREMFPAVEPLPDFTGGSGACAMGHDSGGVVILAHAPAVIGWRPFDGPRVAHFNFGLMPGAIRDGNYTDGVTFRVVAVAADGGERELFSRRLRPAEVEADRGIAAGEAAVPAGCSVLLVTDPGPTGSNNCDWSFWQNIRIEPAGN